MVATFLRSITSALQARCVSFIGPSAHGPKDRDHAKMS